MINHDKNVSKPYGMALVLTAMVALHSAPLVTAFVPRSYDNKAAAYWKVSGTTSLSPPRREVGPLQAAANQNADRAQEAFAIRVSAAKLAQCRGTTPSVANGEEFLYRNPKTGAPSHIASFTKGLRHTDTSALANPTDFAAFVKAVDSGNELEIANLNLGPERHPTTQEPQWRSEMAKQNNVEVRGWESMAAGLTFDLQGPDAQAIPMPPAPTLTSQEFAAEAAEVYLMALTRDVPFCEWETNPQIQRAIQQLNQLSWFANDAQVTDSEAEIRRRRGTVTVQNLFRGITPGSDLGPILSQYLIGGSNQLGSVNQPDRRNGIIAYGSITIDQRVRVATPNKDYLTQMDEFLDAQDGADFRNLETYEPAADGGPKKRLIQNMRDVATYVHYDALYEAYLNACLILLADGVPFDPNLPFQQEDKIDKHQNFVNFGGPHVLSVVTEVATRALKAVRYQKFNVHRRLRPEALGGLINAHKQSNGQEFPEITDLVETLDPILQDVKNHNSEQNASWKTPICQEESYLLPMAFAEGSPMHPAYGAGHAVVAGACVTVLKAFFDANHQLKDVFEVDPAADKLVESSLEGTLTVAGELNKLASNIAVGRNMAGVHWFTDSYDSLLLGEEIAIGILQEQKLTFGENFAFNLPKFDGTTIRI